MRGYVKPNDKKNLDHESSKPTHYNKSTPWSIHIKIQICIKIKC